MWRTGFLAASAVTCAVAMGVVFTAGATPATSHATVGVPAERLEVTSRDSERTPIASDAADSLDSSENPEASVEPTPEPASEVKVTNELKAKTGDQATKLSPATGQTCGASFYDEPQMTASGERFDPNAMTAAHKTLPLGTKVKVTNPRTGATVIVRINDRGPYVGGRCLDLSRASFAAIGNIGSGVMTVTWEVV